MTIEATERDLKDLIAHVAKRKLESLDPGDRLERVLGIDSLDVLRLIAAAEERYGVAVSDTQLVALCTYGDLLAILEIGAEEAAS